MAATWVILSVAAIFICVNSVSADSSPDNRLRCLSCRGEAKFCEGRDVRIRCPPQTDNVTYTPEQLKHFRCTIELHRDTGLLYQGCTSKCVAESTESLKRVCTAKYLGNCIDSQCSRIQDADGIISGAVELSLVSLFSTVIICLLTLRCIISEIVIV